MPPPLKVTGFSWRVIRSVWIFTVCHVSTRATILIFELCGGAERQSRSDRFITIVLKRILFIHGGFSHRCQVRSDQQSLHGLLYVFTLTEINKSRNIVGPLQMCWLTSVFSLLPWHIKTQNWLLKAKILKAQSLISPTTARVTLLKVSVSKYFLSQFTE